MYRTICLQTSSLFLVTAFASLGILACSHSAPPAKADVDAANLPGHDIAQQLCSSCHEIGRTGTSPHPDALPFRLISARYPVRNLEEALAEGIFVGHPDMPDFQFAPEEIDSLLDYIEAIQDPP